MAITQIKGSNIADGTVVAADVADDAVTTAKILDANVTTAKILDANVTDAKIAGMAASKLTGTVPVAGLDATPDTDHTANGPQTNILTSGYSSTIIDLVYLGSSSKWLEADADATGTSINLLGIALEAKTDTQAMNVALAGSFVRDDTWAWTPGVPLYISGTLGAITATKPTGTGDVVRTVGYAVTADIIFFNPSSDYVTLA
jgi:hypothetical protein